MMALVLGVIAALRLLRIERPVGRCGRHVDGNGVQREQGVHVVLVVRFEEYYLVTRVEQRHAGAVEHSRRACAHYDLAFRVYVHAVVAAHLLGYGVPELGESVIAGVYVEPVIHGLLRSLSHREGYFHIADALSKVDSANLVALDAHRPDL